MEYPRVLVISNNSFSQSNSNGRTLGILFKGWPKDKLAQFCMMTDGPDWEVCDNYFCVSDREAVKSLLPFYRVRRNDLQNTYGQKKGERTHVKRTALTSYIRQIVWQLGNWHKGNFTKWLNSVSPQIVIIQSGDTSFTHDIARNVAKKYQASLAFFNTEGIYFLKNNFMYKGVADWLFFPLYMQIYKRSYENAMKQATFAFYLHEGIQKDNAAVFTVPSEVIYNSTSFVPSEKEFNTDNPVISFFGNFSYGRAKVLAEIGRILQSINPQYKVNVFGQASEEDKTILNNAVGVNYLGFVPYSKTREEIIKSDILLHVESQDPYFEEILRYGFSTKIADSLASGRSFVVYSSPDIACYRYLESKHCAWVSHDEETFRNVITKIISQPDIRQMVISNAIEVATLNHNAVKNQKVFQQTLRSIKNANQ